MLCEFLSCIYVSCGFYSVLDGINAVVFDVFDVKGKET